MDQPLEAFNFTFADFFEDISDLVHVLGKRLRRRSWHNLEIVEFGLHRRDLVLQRRKQIFVFKRLKRSDAHLAKQLVFGANRATAKPTNFAVARFPFSLVSPHFLNASLILASCSTKALEMRS